MAIYPVAAENHDLLPRVCGALFVNQSSVNRPLLTKEEVHYRSAVRERRCGSCVAFLPSLFGCQLVAGEIAADMCCDRWRPLKHSDLSQPKQ
jgi:hypothetical protein